jgi:4-amino-4-deoxy-L-arabinose transferase-like glycosyltransferase
VPALYDRPEKMSFIVGAVLSLAILFSWAGVIFFIQWFRYDGCEDTQITFLERNYKFFTMRTTKPPYPELSSKVLREKGWAGMGMIGMPMILLGLNITVVSVILSVLILFFGGLALGQSWYAGRSLRKLGLDSYTPTEPIKPARSTRYPT